MIRSTLAVVLFAALPCLAWAQTTQPDEELAALKAQVQALAAQVEALAAENAALKQQVIALTRPTPTASTSGVASPAVTAVTDPLAGPTHFPSVTAFRNYRDRLTQLYALNIPRQEKMDRREAMGGGLGGQIIQFTAPLKSVIWHPTSTAPRFAALEIDGGPNLSFKCTLPVEAAAGLKPGAIITVRGRIGGSSGGSPGGSCYDLSPVRRIQ